MARGVVITARGERLSMDELIMRSQKPKSQEGDMKDTVPSRKAPPRQLNMRGFVPSAVGVPAQIGTQRVEIVKPAASIADFTGIKIDTPKRLKSRPQDTEEATNEALREIMTDLEQYDTRRQKKTP